MATTRCKKMVRYQLKHKNDIGAEVLFDEEKGALSEVLSVCDESLLPLCSQNGHADNLKIWWHNRAVPQSRSDIRHLLDKEKVQTTQSFLLNNLGLSMTDAFWTWKRIKSFRESHPDGIDRRRAEKDMDGYKWAHRAAEG